MPLNIHLARTSLPSLLQRHQDSPNWPETVVLAEVVGPVAVMAARVVLAAMAAMAIRRAKGVLEAQAVRRVRMLRRVLTEAPVKTVRSATADHRSHPSGNDSPKTFRQTNSHTWRALCLKCGLIAWRLS